MKIDINLLSKKRKVNKTKGIVSRVAIAILLLFSLYFFSSASWVTYKLITLNKGVEVVGLETVLLSNEIAAKNDTVMKYVLSKSILDFFDSLQKSKFHYKLYLDQIVGLMPEEVFLKNVDFANKGWISVSLQITNYVSLRRFEEVLSKNNFAETTVFQSMYIESVSRDKSGQYTVKMQFAIKNNV